MVESFKREMQVSKRKSKHGQGTKPAKAEQSRETVVKSDSGAITSVLQSFSKGYAKFNSTFIAAAVALSEAEEI